MTTTASHLCARHSGDPTGLLNGECVTCELSHLSAMWRRVVAEADLPLGCLVSPGVVVDALRAQGRAGSEMELRAVRLIKGIDAVEASALMPFLRGGDIPETIDAVRLVLVRRVLEAEAQLATVRGEMAAPAAGELLPCPFCGNEPSLRSASNDESWWIVECAGRCDMSPRCESQSRDGLVAAWNTRAVERRVRGL
jgi:Restriction alleviation protein Lar